jgi:hypothetical protein
MVGRKKNSATRNMGDTFKLTNEGNRNIRNQLSVQQGSSGSVSGFSMN